MEGFEVINAGVEATIQDVGRRGWRRFGVPPSGAMDMHAAAWANKLLENPPNAPFVELLYAGARLRVITDAWIAVTGADCGANVSLWRTTCVRAGAGLNFPEHRSGMWSYLAVEGGFKARRILDSASVYRRGGLGNALRAGDILERAEPTNLHLPAGVSGRLVPFSERRDYRSIPVLRVWKGPQWEFFGEPEQFFQTKWVISSQSDRAGYRLSGVQLKARSYQIISEPVLVGSIQVPESGQPIVTMRDGPTVGGYPKLALLHADDVSWLAQCEPGRAVSFKLIESNLSGVT